MTAVLFAASFLQYVFGILMFLTAVFLILLVLVQRGRGGGLTGALGGMGGQSAFGAKAGDVFTRVTMITATVWILLCILAIRLLNSQDEWGASSPNTPASVSVPVSDDDTTSTGEAPDGAGATVTGADSTDSVDGDASPVDATPSDSASDSSEQGS
jgi:preprotein translocase subunit SecG